MTIERKDLSPRQTITLGNDKYTISGKRGDGTSSIVYDATTHIEALNKPKKVLIKELFPVNLNIRRDSVGALIIPKASVDLFKKYKESFINAAKLQLDFHNPSEDADTASSTNSTSNLENLYECGNTLYSVMSLDDGQTYEEYNSDDLRSHIEICRNLALAIGRYHERGYLHLDIKPENIFVLAGSNNIKLFDFDTVQRKEDITHQNCQLSYTQAYAPPELLLAETDSDYYAKIDERTDIYMIGATLLYKLFGRTPTFMDQLFFQTWDFDKSAATKRTSPQVREELTYILRKTLSDEQEDRFNNNAELITALNHILDLLKFDYYLINHNINRTSGNDYIPRTQEIQSVRNILNQYHMAYLYGMGGIGKSETARAYVEEYRNDYSVIQLIGYQTDLAKTIASLSFSDDEGFNDNAHNEDDRYKMVFTRLSDKLLNNERTLIIIDNYNYISDVAKDISEKDQKVLETNRKVLQDLNKLSIHFIFTTRNTPLPHDIRQGIEIKEFSIDELRELFFRINPIDKDNPERIKKVDKILELTGLHTLTVDLIARQSVSIEGMGNHTLDDLIDVISRSGMNNEVDVIVSNNKDEKDTYDIVYNHIKVLFDFTRLSETEEYVLATAALLPITGMKEKDFCELIAIDKVSNQPTGWGLNKTITKLVESGWLRRSGHDTVITSMHPIIADVVLNELQLFFINNAFPFFYDNLENSISTFFENRTKNRYPAKDYYHLGILLTSGVYGEILFKIILKVPFCHNNFISISNLANYVIRSMHIDVSELYIDKAMDYFKNNECTEYEIAWFYKLVCMESCLSRLNSELTYADPIMEGLLMQDYDDEIADGCFDDEMMSDDFSEHIIDPTIYYSALAKALAIASLQFFNPYMSYIEKARLSEEFAYTFSYAQDFDNAIHFCKEALNYYNKANDQDGIANIKAYIGYNYMLLANNDDDERVDNLIHSKRSFKSAIKTLIQSPNDNEEKIRKCKAFLKQIRKDLDNASN